MKISVLGAGAIGSLVAGYLSDKGQETALVGRPEAVNAIREKGLQISGVRGDFNIKLDASCRLSPLEWAQRALNLFDELKADIIVAEKQGTGDLVETIMRQIRPGIPYKGVPAYRGKILRAQPVSALAEQGRLSMVGYFPELEEQMLNYTGEPGEGSPDRLDAYVHAVTALEIGLSGSADRMLSAFGVKCGTCGQFSPTGSAMCAGCGSRLSA